MHKWSENTWLHVELCYLYMQLPGQDGSSCTAQVTDEAVEENRGFSRIFSPNFAPLIHEPSQLPQVNVRYVLNEWGRWVINDNLLTGDMIAAKAAQKER